MSSDLVVSAAFESVDNDLGRQFGPQVRVHHGNVFVAVRDQYQFVAVLSGHHQEFRVDRVRRLRRFDERRDTRYWKTSDHVYEYIVRRVKKKKKKIAKSVIKFLIYLFFCVRSVAAIHS